MDQQKLLLTGVTGFLGSHTAIQLLNKGYKVTGTLRNLNRINSIKDVIGRYTHSLDNLWMETFSILSHLKIPLI